MSLSDLKEKPKTRLRNLKIDRVDLVDAGASRDKATGEGAHVLLLKRAEEGELISVSKPYPNEHAARMTNPDKYVRIRRQNDKFGSGIHAIFGITNDGTTELQAVRFDKDKFTAAGAKAWLKEHDMKPLGFEAASEKTGRDDQMENQEIKELLETLDESAAAKLTTYIEALEAKIAELTKAAPAKPEDVIKSLAPEIRAIVEKAQADSAEAIAKAKKLEDERDLAEQQAVCKAWTHMAVPELATLPAELVKLKRALPDTYAAVVKQLDAANAASKLGKELGSAGAETGSDALDQIENRAAELIASGKAKSHEDAVAKVADANPGLYTQYRKEISRRQI